VARRHNGSFPLESAIAVPPRLNSKTSGSLFVDMYLATGNRFAAGAQIWLEHRHRRPASVVRKPKFVEVNLE
jgi:hypothetical protein